ncbi:peptidase inhibitor family I36 protein [Amycolatopsis sp. NPDC026612]|uniref:peptidase inhibitor family I36 protein n=1 Tax=Amycolatopsis sp. NPDC026612 TaxID=3155466 RepID=UPI0033DF847F
MSMKNRSRTIRRAFTAAAVPVLATAALATMAPPASADNNACPVDRVCLFRNSNFSGGRYVDDGTTLRLSLARWDNGGSVDNSASSVINNTNRTFQLHERYYVPCLGPMLTVRAHTEYADFSSTYADYPDNTTKVNDIFSCLVGLP